MFVMGKKVERGSDIFSPVVRAALSPEEGLPRVNDAGGVMFSKFACSNGRHVNPRNYRLFVVQNCHRRKVVSLTSKRDAFD